MKSSLLYLVAVLLALWLLLKKAPAAGGGVGTTSGGSIGKGTSVAEKNNNPLNIRVGKSPWQGKIPHKVGQDARFEAFATWVHGIRAGILNMRHHYNLGKKSLRTLINTWAPPSDGNDTSEYVRLVSEGAGIHPDSPFLFERATVRNIVKKMAQVEAGYPTIDDASFNAAWSMTTA